MDIVLRMNIRHIVEQALNTVIAHLEKQIVEMVPIHIDLATRENLELN